MRGSIRQRSADSWLLQIELDRVGNKRRRRFVTVKGSRRDAQRELTKLLSAADDGNLCDPTRMTLGAYAEQSLDVARELSPKTLERYQQLLHNQLAPHLGDVKLTKLRAEHVEQWHGALLAAGLATRTVRSAHRLLSRVLARAVKNNTLAANVALKVKPPTVEAKEIEILTASEVKALIAGLAGHELHPIAVLAVTSGARRGEILALEWGDIDLDRGVVRIERSVEQTDAGVRVKPTKTRSGKRNVTLSAAAIAVLREHRRQQIERRLLLGQGGQPTLVFSDIEGRHIKPDSLSRNWRRVCEARGLPSVNFHALRHVCVSLLLANNVDILTISRRIGHSSASLVLSTYAHLVEGSDAAAATRCRRFTGF